MSQIELINVGVFNQILGNTGLLALSRLVFLLYTIVMLIALFHCALRIQVFYFKMLFVLFQDKLNPLSSKSAASSNSANADDGEDPRQKWIKRILLCLSGLGGLYLLFKFGFGPNGGNSGGAAGIEPKTVSNFCPSKANQALPGVKASNPFLIVETIDKPKPHSLNTLLIKLPSVLNQILKQDLANLAKLLQKFTNIFGKGVPVESLNPTKSDVVGPIFFDSLNKPFYKGGALGYDRFIPAVEDAHWSCRSIHSYLEGLDPEDLFEVLEGLSSFNEVYYDLLNSQDRYELIAHLGYDKETYINDLINDNIELFNSKSQKLASSELKIEVKSVFYKYLSGVYEHLMHHTSFNDRFHTSYFGVFDKEGQIFIYKKR